MRIETKKAIEKITLFYRIFLVVIITGATGYLVSVPFFEYMPVSSLILYIVLLAMWICFAYLILSLAWEGD